jgi:predicted aconitase with swiveling domain
VSDAPGSVRARVLHPGAGSGAVCTIPPVSCWGGVGADGTIADVHHPAHGTSLVGRALVMETSKGSSSGSSVLAELIVTGRAPALIALSQPDAVLVSGCLAAVEISGASLPIVQVTPADLRRLGEAPALAVDCAGVQIGQLTTVGVHGG